MHDFDWYSQGLSPMLRNDHRWVCWYADYSGHFVDDFGNMVRVGQYVGSDTFVFF